ncbi:MAG: pyridoxamine kinase [Lachnospiraceae bacterium]|nr:pyridoxamine kinase [Lachnospiraceae bacterium]
MKRIVTIQDISCIGKCSLTVALPIISAMGIETAILPTAVLSTHTMFTGFTWADLTNQVEPIAAHWKKENFHFDAIYTGYLGSFQQIHQVRNFFEQFREQGTTIFIDPVMADNGKLYAGFDLAFAGEMAKLCQKADIIVPNITEASFLTGMPYKETYDESYLKEMLRRLAGLGPKYAVLTGVSLSPDRIGILGLDCAAGEYFFYDTVRLPVSYHGTGDIFSSTTVGALMNGFSLPDALKTACDYTMETIRVTVANPDSRSYGVDFETTMPRLLQLIGKI